MRAAPSLRGSMPTTASAHSRRLAATYAANAQRETLRRLQALDAAVKRVLGLMEANGHAMGPLRTERSGTGAVCIRCGAWACVRQNPRRVMGEGNYAVYAWDLTDAFSDPTTRCSRMEAFKR